MASNYTEHIGLCQWKPTDQVLRTEFNQDNAKVDAALDTLEQAVTQHGEALETQAAAIAKLGNCIIYHTTYTGNNQFSRIQTFPGTPMAVMVAETDSGTGFIAWRGMTVVKPFHQQYGTIEIALTWGSDSLSWSYETNFGWAMNSLGSSYQLIGLLTTET